MGETKAGRNTLRPTRHAAPDRRRGENVGQGGKVALVPGSGVLCKERSKISPAWRAAVTYGRWDHHLSQRGPVLQEDDERTFPRREEHARRAAPAAGTGPGVRLQASAKMGFQPRSRFTAGSAVAEGKRVPVQHLGTRSCTPKKMQGKGMVLNSTLLTCRREQFSQLVLFCTPVPRELPAVRTNDFKK